MDFPAIGNRLAPGRQAGVQRPHGPQSAGWCALAGPDVIGCMHAWYRLDGSHGKEIAQGGKIMKELLTLIAAGLLVLTATAAAANPLPVEEWETGATVLGLYGTGDPPIIATLATAPEPVYSGAYSLRLEDNSPTDTPQAYVAFIWGLSDGEQVSVYLYRYDDTPDASPSCRLWGHWNDELPGNPDGYSGSAGGNSDYGMGTGWEEVSYTWTVTGGHTGLVIEVRTYSSPGDVVYIDEMVIIPSSSCTYQTPSYMIVSGDQSSFGKVKALYR
jgi:hypothetical protein